MRRALGLLIALSPLLVGCSSARFHCNLGPPHPPSPPGDRSSPPECLVTNPGYRPTKLVFQGGGVKGIAYVGALQILEQQEILQGVTDVAGTSAGAITAALVAVGYQPDEIEAIMLELEFSNFEDGGAGGIFRIFRRYGYFKGDYFLSWMRCAVRRKTGKHHTTFRDLHPDEGYRNLRLFTTDVNAGAIQELSVHTTPDLEVALAVRMSMSIPLFFASVEHERFARDEPTGEHVFVDGGVLFNYPVTVFDRDEPNPQTLGFVLLDTGKAKRPLRVDSLLSYSRALVEADLNVQVDELKFQRPNLVRTAVIDDLGVPTTDFAIDRAGKLDLVESGARCTCRYLRNRPRDAEEIEELMSPLPPGQSVPEANFEHCGWVL